MTQRPPSLQLGPAGSALLIAALLVLTAIVAYTTALGSLRLFATVVMAILFVVLMLSHLRLAVILAVGSIPLEDFLVLGDAGTVTKLLIIGLGGSYLFHLLRGRLPPRWGALSPVGWLWLCWAAASLFWSGSPQVGQITSLVQLVLLAFVIAAIVIERPALVPTILWTYTLSACVIATLGTIHFISGIQELGPVRTSGGPGQGVEHFAAYLVPAFIFLVLYALKSRKHWLGTSGVFVLITLLVFGLLVSGTRSAWMGAIAALFVVVIPTQKPRQLVALVAVILLLIASVSRMPGIEPFVAERATGALSDGGAGRLDIWKVGLGLVADAPIAGVGFSNFPMHFGVQEIRDTPLALHHRHLFIGRAPHSIYLGTLTELGVVGFLLLIAWFLPVLFAIRGNTVTMLAVRGAFFAYLVQGIYLDILNRKYFWLFLGLAEGCRLIIARREQTHSDDVSAYRLDHEQLPLRS